MKVQSGNTGSGICVLAILAVLTASCAMTPTAKVTSSGGPSIGEAQSIAYDGPKARIAVSSFRDKSAKGYRRIGDGMADMMTTELFNTNRFIVLERQQLDEVLQEQDLASSGRIKPGTEAPTGEIEGAELLITGVITEFEPDAGGVGGGVLLGGFGLGAGGKKSHVAIDLRVIDAKTSRILAATTVEGEAKDVGGLAGIGVGALGVGLGGFSKTPMEKAIRIAIREGVNFIASQTPAQFYRH